MSLFAISTPPARLPQAACSSRRHSAPSGAPRRVPRVYTKKRQFPLLANLLSNSVITIQPSVEAECWGTLKVSILRFRSRMTSRSLLLLALVPSALATIISDGGFACIFNANGVAATPAQRGLTAPVPALSTLGPYDVRREGAGTTPRRRPRRRAAPRLSSPRSRASPSLLCLTPPLLPPHASAPPPRRRATSAARRTRPRQREGPGR